MIKISSDKVLLLHQLITQETGGSADILDYGLLDSAIESAYATFDSIDLYPSKEEKAAKLGYGLIANHAFVDGNKRIGIYVMLTFLQINGINIDATNSEIIELGLNLAKGIMKYNELLSWFSNIKINIVM